MDSHQTKGRLGPVGRQVWRVVQTVEALMGVSDPVGVAAQAATMVRRHGAPAGGRTVRDVARYAAQELAHAQTSNPAQYWLTTFRNALGCEEKRPSGADPFLDAEAEHAEMLHTQRMIERDRDAWAKAKAEAIPAPELAVRISATVASLHKPDFDAVVTTMRQQSRQWTRPAGATREPVFPRRGPGTILDALADSLESQGHYFVPPAKAYAATGDEPEGDSDD